MKTSRRTVLSAGLIGLGTYIYQRGLRFPRMGFEHKLVNSFYSSPSLELAPANLLLLQKPSGNADFNYRALAPEPSLSIKSNSKQRFSISLNNISKDAYLEVIGSSDTRVSESISGTSRTLELSFSQGAENSLHWKLVEQDGLDFAVIGDTGAGLELEWVLHRAYQLNAKFLLHLGDFNYADGEYDRAIELFYSAELPCYISIGNHDYNASGLIYDKFIRELGPMNHVFSFAGTRFVNIDSAASFFPPYSGHRGELIQQLSSGDKLVSDNVFYTHKPFEDPRPGRGHDIGGWREIDWLHNSMLEINADTILTGHVHRSAELDYNGIKQYTAGEGLAYQDIVHKKLVSKILMGRVETGRKVQYRWEQLNMPWSAHTSPTHEVKLKKEQPIELLDWYRKNI